MVHAWHDLPARPQSPDDAVNALLDANLAPGERRNRFHDSVPRGQVIRTDPRDEDRLLGHDRGGVVGDHVSSDAEGLGVNPEEDV